MKSQNHVMTVLGPVPADELGLTLPHEHLFINEMREQRNIGLVNDASMLERELKRFRKAGGVTLVDTTTASLADGAEPDPYTVLDGPTAPSAAFRQPGTTRSASGLRMLQRLSRDSGVNIVVGTGQYREPYLDTEWINQSSVEAVSDQFVREVEEGIDGTEVRAGIIGEIGSDGWYVSALEERCFRAAGRAQARTGVAVTTHAARWPVGLAQLDLLECEGADPSRVIVGHCDSLDLPGYHAEVARRGAFVEFDSIRGVDPEVVERRIRFVLNMLAAGYLEQVLLSHDCCYTTHFHEGGGTGLDYVPTGFRTALAEHGLSDEEFHQLTVLNPLRALTGRDSQQGEEQR